MININDYNREDIMVSCIAEAIYTLIDAEDDDEILTESIKTSKKYKLDNYLKRFNYQGDKKSGTIEVDGKKYNIDRDIKNKFMKTKNIYGNPDDNVDRATSTDLTDPKNDTIHLDKNFVNLKNNKRRDAVLQHEIGHAKLHQLNKDNTKEGRDATLDGLAKTNPFMPKEDVKNALVDDLKDRDKSHESKTPAEKQRAKNLEKFKKYENNMPHADRVEYEADAYAGVHKNGDHLKRAIRESYTHARKDNKKMTYFTDPDDGEKYYIDNDEKKIFVKSLNKLSQNDMKQRGKAAKDKSIDRSIYQ